MRYSMSLDGLWRFVADLDPAYHGESLYQDMRADCRHWDVVRVPGCWNLYAERYRLFEGVGWFAREFHLDELPPHPVATLRFGGVNYHATVFLNGERVGEHEGGYTEFTLDVTDHVRTGRNVLVVRVDNRATQMKLPAVLGWFNYGGIHRSVDLEVTERAQIERVLVHAVPEGRRAVGQIRVRLASRCDASPVRVRAEVVFWPGPQLVWEASGVVEGSEWSSEIAFDDPRTWSPETPDLYVCNVQLLDADNEELDDVGTLFGVRRLAVSDGRLTLNGSPVFLRGISYLSDHPACGVCYDPEVLTHDFAELGELGVNAVRSHFPPDESFLDDCDRWGLMAWVEVPAYCLTAPEAFASEGYQALAKQMAREMVEQAYNHPSVVIWSVGNECSDHLPEAEPFFGGIVETIRSLDPHRLVGYAALYGGIGHATRLVDIPGVNEYWGWYDRGVDGPCPGAERELAPGEEVDLGKLRECLAHFVAEHPGKPILMTEFGADAEPGFRSAERKLWSEDYQAHLLEATFAEVARCPQVAGTFPFLYQDYRDPSKRTNHRWRGLNLKGIVSYDRTRKCAFDTLRTIYQRLREEPSP